MPSSLRPSDANSFGDELVRIDKVGYKSRFAKFKDRILDEFRWTLADLLEFQRWWVRKTTRTRGESGRRSLPAVPRSSAKTRGFPRP